VTIQIIMKILDGICYAGLRVGAARIFLGCVGDVWAPQLLSNLGPASRPMHSHYIPIAASCLHLPLCCPLLSAQQQNSSSKQTRRSMSNCEVFCLSAIVSVHRRLVTASVVQQHAPGCLRSAGIGSILLLNAASAAVSQEVELHQVREVLRCECTAEAAVSAICA
jgi:hypothetical protein